MKQLSLLLLTIFITLVTGFEKANALFEARVNYGLLAGRPDLSVLSFGGATDFPSAAANYGVGADALFVLPLVGLGAGLRYENLGFKFSQNNLDYKSTTSRTALLVNYRIINTLLYLGPIFSYGLSHSNNITVGYGGSTADLTPDSSSSYTVGLEAGAKLGGFMVGGEAGYESLKWTSLKDKNNLVTSSPNLDMSGTYLKVVIGFGI